MVDAILTFFAYAVLAIGAENVIFTRALGISSGLRVIDNPNKDTFYFCVSLTVFQLINSLLAYAVVPAVAKTPLGEYTRFLGPVIVVICCAVSYMIVIAALSVSVKKSFLKRIIVSLTGASINSAIVGTIIFSIGQNYNLAQTIGFAIGSSIGYFLAMLIIAEGEKKIHEDAVPAPFKGLPVTLIYIGIVALAIYGLTGHTTAL